MGKEESCDVMLLQQDRVTGAFHTRSRRAVVWVQALGQRLQY